MHKGSDFEYDDELEQHDIEIIDLEAQERENVKYVIIQEKESEIKYFMDNLEIANFVITYIGVRKQTTNS